MNLDDNPQEAAFRAEARAWLEANKSYGEAPTTEDSTEYVGRSSPQLARARAWQARKAEAGYAAITWPKEYGGRDGTPIQAVIYAQEEARAGLRSRGFFDIGLGMCIPTMIDWAPKETLEARVPPALRGDDIWCQLFSEPGSGSDAAGARTRAERDGDDWIINGQKVWTTGAQIADYAILLARSDFAAPKHKGMTFFWFDMRSEGVETRPIRQMSGDARFNEVFLRDVRIPDSQRLGAVGEGWAVAVTTLLHERFSVGLGDPAASHDWRALLETARALVGFDGRPAVHDRAVRDNVADWYVRDKGLKFTHYRMLTALSRGERPGPEASIGKVVLAAMNQTVGAQGMDMAGMAGALTGAEAVDAGAYPAQWLRSAGMRIAGGTDEILRNIIAERVLGLPPEPRVDKTVPFNEIPSGR